MIEEELGLEEAPSRSQIKREMLELQLLGSRLMALGPKAWDAFPLTEELRSALTESLRIHEKSAIKRHRKRLGKLLREADAEAIRARLDLNEQHQQQQRYHFHQLEQWRDRLLGEGDSALSELLTLFPGADCQQLRQLLRQAQRETQQQRPPVAARKLFKYLRAHIPFQESP